MNLIKSIGISEEAWNQASDILIDDLLRRLGESVELNTAQGWDSNPNPGRQIFDMVKGLFTDELPRRGWWDAGNIHNLESEYTHLPTVGEMHLWVIHQIMNAAVGDNPHHLIPQDIIKNNRAFRNKMKGTKYDDLWKRLNRGAKLQHGFLRYSDEDFMPTSYFWDRKGRRGEMVGQGHFGMNIYKAPTEAEAFQLPEQYFSWPWTFDGSTFPETLDANYRTAQQTAVTRNSQRNYFVR